MLRPNRSVRVGLEGPPKTARRWEGAGKVSPSPGIPEALHVPFPTGLDRALPRSSGQGLDQIRGAYSWALPASEEDQRDPGPWEGGVHRLLSLSVSLKYGFHKGHKMAH